MTKNDSLKDDMIASFLDANPKDGIDIVFSFDTTGSMQPILDQVRGQVKRICEELYDKLERVKISIITHGDFCDDNSRWCKEGMIQVLDFTGDKDKLIKHVTTVGVTGGEGAHAGYEYVLGRAVSLAWRPKTAKALVLIGDVVPNPPSWTDQEFYWRTEMNKLYKKGVKIYGVQAYGFAFSMPFYQELARRTGGCYLPLSQMGLISDMLCAISYREAGQLEKFKKENTRKMEDVSYKAMVESLDRKLGNVRVRDQNAGWWDIAHDKGAIHYVKNSKGKYDRYYGLAKFPTRKPPKLSMKDNISSLVSAETENEGYSQRTGGKIIDTSSYSSSQLQKMKDNRDKVMVAAKDSGYRLVMVKPGVWEFVTKTELQKRELNSDTAEDEGSQQAVHQKIERNKLMQQANDQMNRILEANTEKLSISKDEKKKYAVQRLMRDLIEMKKTPLYGVSAMPLDSNIMEWHANITGPMGTTYDGVNFHLVIKFPSSYPRKPPTIRICTRLLHPNVYGNWVCLDMLEIGAFGSEKEADRINTGWSSGYSVVSILLQLQSFLFSDALTDEEDELFCDKIHVKAAARQADNFVCPTCSHNNKDATGNKEIWPPYQTDLPENSMGSATPLEKIKKKPKKGKSSPLRLESPKVVAKESPAPVALPKSVSAPAPAALPQKQPTKISVATLELGAPVEGVVIEVREGLGAFVDIGTERSALLHVSEMRETRVESIAKDVPEIKVGNKINGFVCSIDSDKNRVGITVITNPISREYKKQKLMDFSNLAVGDHRIGRIAAKHDECVFVNIDVYDGSRKKLGKLPKKALINPQRPIVWSAADVFANESYIAVVVTEIDRVRGNYLLAPAPENVVSTNVAPTLVPKSSKKEIIQTAALCNLDLLTLFNILKYLNPITMGRLGSTCKMLRKLTDDGISYLWERNEILCFHSKRHFSEDTLGIGVNLESKMNGKLAYITCTYDLVSHTAFLEEEVRKAAYKEKFSHWLPVYINNDHGKRAMQLAKIHMAKICADCYGSFEPWMVLEIMPKLMNTMVVSVMSGKLYGSIMALEGYCGFHHMLLNLMIEYPELRAKADEIIKNFINDPYKRHKKEVPALGEFLPLLTVSETYKWEDVAFPYLMEMFDRNVLWTLKKHKELATPAITDAQKKVRLERTFDATMVSNHLLMFHVYFLKKIARPEGMSLKQVSDLLDLRYGRPTYSMKDQLLKEVKSIRKLKTWDGFFQKIGIMKPADSTLAEIFNTALENSSRKRYHRPTDFIEEKPIITEKKQEKIEKEDKYDRWFYNNYDRHNIY